MTSLYQSIAALPHHHPRSFLVVCTSCESGGNRRARFAAVLHIDRDAPPDIRRSRSASGKFAPIFRYFKSLTLQTFVICRKKWVRFADLSRSVEHILSQHIWNAMQFWLVACLWLQIQRSRVRSPALPDFLSSSGSGTGSTQPREVNWGATWMKK